MHCHGNVGDHLVVNKLVCLGKYYVAVQSEEASEFGTLKYVDTLKFAFSRKKLPVNAYAHFNVVRVHFRKPHIQAQSLLYNLKIIRSGVCRALNRTALCAGK